MRRWAGLLVSILLVALSAWAQQEPHHALPGAPAKVDVQDDPGSRALTIRLGPLNLPAQGHTQVLGSLLTFPFDGWLLRYRPRLVDDRGVALPGRLLHHVDFFNTARRNFLCPRFDEVFFASGGEMTAWPVMPDAGYRVAKGHRIRMNAMFHNVTDRPFLKIYLEVRVDYKLLSDGPMRNAYPAFVSVTQCRPTTEYDLEPGGSVEAAQFTVGFPGTLLGVGGHLHDYGRQLSLENATRNDVIAKLDAELDPEGRLVSVPVVFPGGGSGYRLNRGDVVSVAATYQNPTGRRLPNAAMGIVVGYFLPDDDEAYAQAMTKSPPR